MFEDSAKYEDSVTHKNHHRDLDDNVSNLIKQSEVTQNQLTRIEANLLHHIATTEPIVAAILETLKQFYEEVNSIKSE